MRTLSLDLRERIVTSYDRKEGTRLEIATRYRISLGMVKKLLHQRRDTGDLRPRHYRSGRKPKVLARHEQQMRTLLASQPDLTLKELRHSIGLSCTLPAIHYALQRMGLTYKKRHSMPVSKTAQTSPGHGGAGASTKVRSTRPG